MNAKSIYKIWCEKVKDSDLRSELLKISSDENEIINRFSNKLSFGTAGTRGLIGVGTNRINSVTVSNISQAFALHLKKEFRQPSVVISYDTRKFSYEFAKISAEIFASLTVTTGSLGMLLILIIFLFSSTDNLLSLF